MTETDKVVFYAGASERRTACLKELPDVAEVHSIGGGEEPDIPNVYDITLMKIAYAMPRVLQDVGRLNGHAVVAADARTEITTFKNSTEPPRIAYESKGKPREVSETQANFGKLWEVSQRNGSAEYRVVSASAVFDKVGSQKEIMQAAVRLPDSALEYLVSDDGFQAYVRAFDHFYSQPPYSTTGLSPIDPTNLSGGISLPVLLNMGLVDKIDGSDIRKLKEKEAKKVTEAALFTVAVGFGPKVLDRVHPQAVEAVLRWSWLTQLSEKVYKHYMEAVESR